MSILSGLTVNGFLIKTFEEINDEVKTKLQDSFGVINLDESSVFSQFSGIYSEREALIWFALGALYNSLDPDTASGFSLDNIAAYTNITRQNATYTTTQAQLTGINQTLILENSEATATGVNAVFKLDNEVSISNDRAVSINIEVVDITLTVYKINVNGTLIEYPKVPGDGVTEIIFGLITLINLVFTNVEATNVNNILNIRSLDSNLLSVYVVDGLSIFDVTVLGNFTSDTLGFIPLPANALNKIQTPIVGWKSVNNPLAGITGRNIETDNELRIRRLLSSKIGGSTPEGIRARVLNVPGVTSCKVIENRLLVPDADGRPGNSFETLVLGGVDLAVATAIWLASPAATATFGTVSVTIIDSSGDNQIIKFSRPAKVYIFVTVTITLDTSGSYPTEGDSVIIDGINNQINMLTVGQDVIYQSLNTSIFSVPGISSAVITIGGTLVEGTPPVQSSANVIISNTQTAVTDITKINIIKI
jgi:uncharacterized phage protein gp47/JayE